MDRRPFTSRLPLPRASRLNDRFAPWRDVAKIPGRTSLKAAVQSFSFGSGAAGAEHARIVSYPPIARVPTVRFRASRAGEPSERRRSAPMGRFRLLATEIMNAIMDALAAYTTMNKQALESERVREGLKDVLLGPGELYEALRERGGAADAG